MKIKNKKYHFNILKFLFATLLLTGTYGLYSYSPDTLSSNINENEVPYLSTYYIKPIVNPYEDVIIDFYVTDYNHNEYVEETFDYTFTITVKVEGKDDIILKDLKGGDHSVNLGKFSNLGEQKFSIIATDQHGRNSHELFNFFLVKNSESNLENHSLINEYIMTEEDLLKYNIKNTDNYEVKNIQTLNLNNPTSTTVKAALEEASKNITPSSNTYTCIIADTKGNGEHGQWWRETIVKYSSDYDKNAVMEESKNTRIGLQKFLDDKKAEGFNKVTLIKGVYRIDHTEPIYIPTEFTLDMNGSTFKQNQFTGDKALMINLNNTFDSHVINGTIEGDYYSHDYANSPNNSEWVNGISISGESKYSSFENLIVKDITGYGGTNGIANSRDNSLGYTYIYPKGIGNSFTLGDIDKNTGESISSASRSTSSLIDISGYGEIGYLSISRYLGYQGNPASTWNLIAHFYDENKNFIKSVDGYQYRRIGVPKDAKFMKVTLLSTDKPTDLSIQLFRVPTHCTFKNIKFENCRAVGLAPAAMKDMLVENCEFTKSGQTLAKCAFDAEDGWDLMQDVTFKGLNFYDNPNNEFLTAAGHNFIIEEMKGGKLYFWERTNSYVVRNSKGLKDTTLGHGNKVRTGYSRFFNNTINGNIKIGSTDHDDWKLVVKDSIIKKNAENEINTGLYLRCDIGDSTPNPSIYSSLTIGNFKDCYIHDKSRENHGGIYENCTLENISGNLHNIFIFDNCIISNFNCNAGQYEESYIIKNSTLNNFKIKFPYWYKGANINLENCKITNSDYLLKLPHYSMKKDIVLKNNTIDSTSNIGIINFYDDRTGDSAGDLIHQGDLILESNKINLYYSPYVVTGLNDKTSNNINIISTSNILSPQTLQLCDPKAKQNPNLQIEEK
ncbi:hypothetical protein [Clostridium perfringens]|uniref:Uncharacterized protein n=2 Tax=Clostridium perfringens TaxID=1502 RepID=A0AAP6WPT7_CLOPF|nr:hypothetical protein [Clostridium perfringens]EDT25153.1 hypothetical protein AC1_0563 [Clostridium perfringens B str. ATCC 3626]NGU31645.1 hypothetical protein [Clostridium perfringens]WEV05942.1 hypothetical protein PL322_02925 [Clostridium perfringens B]WEV09015.1 hypothetical protein PL324_03090 [Clostridium perfringens B]